MALVIEATEAYGAHGSEVRFVGSQMTCWKGCFWRDSRRSACPIKFCLTAFTNRLTSSRDGARHQAPGHAEPLTCV
jgi:hypothetical protein